MVIALQMTIYIAGRGSVPIVFNGAMLMNPSSIAPHNLAGLGRPL
jgi:hypothetical protein